MGHDHTGHRRATCGPRRPGAGAGRGGIHRRVDSGGRRDRCVHPARPRLDLGADTAAGHGDCPGLHAGTGPDRDERGLARQRGARPLRSRARRLESDHCLGLERPDLRCALAAISRRSANGSGGVGRRADRWSVRHVLHPAVRAGDATSRATPDHACRIAAPDAAVGRGGSRRRDPELDRPRRCRSLRRRRREPGYRGRRPDIRVPDGRRRVRPRLGSSTHHELSDRARVRRVPPVARARRDPPTDVGRVGGG